MWELQELFLQYLMIWKGNVKLHVDFVTDEKAKRLNTHFHQ